MLGQTCPIFPIRRKVVPGTIVCVRVSFQKWHSAVDIAAYAVTGALLLLALGVPLGLRFDVSCNPFTLADPVCSGIVWTIFLVCCAWLYLGFFMVRAWWSNKELSLPGRVAWFIFGVPFLPYAVVVYYWTVYRRHLARQYRDEARTASELGTTANFH